MPWKTVNSNRIISKWLTASARQAIIVRRTTSSAFRVKRKVWHFLPTVSGYSGLAAGKLNMVMPSTANPACICIRSSSSEPSMRNWSMWCRNSLLKQRYFNFSRMANGLLRKFMTLRRSSSGNTLQQSVRKLRRNFSRHSGLHSGSCIMIRAICCGGISNCRLDGNTDFRHLTSRSTIRPVTMFPKCSPL